MGDKRGPRGPKMGRREQLEDLLASVHDLMAHYVPKNGARARSMI